MKALAIHVKAQPRLYAAAAVGLACAVLLPGRPLWSYRALIGWNVAVWLYLVLIATMMLRADHGHIRRAAMVQAESAPVELVAVVAAAIASVAAIVFELAAIKAQTGSPAWQHLLLASGTIVGSWLLLPTLFALDYASRYYGGRRGAVLGGLAFPGAGADPAFEPDYTDFLYVSFTIAVASQTADVAITSRTMRRMVLLQSLLSFAFNAAILALTINIGAGLF